ncbi:diguanylate cyclase [Streptomyces sp. UP1A-1]|nr:diguanylate cyclase [Streptomyces sp. UP1A-1]
MTPSSPRPPAACGTGAPSHGIAARLGGDEFAAIVTDPARTPGTTALQAALGRPVAFDGRLLPVSASVGLCHRADLPVPALTDALSAADAGMYAAKGHGRRNVHN